MCHLIFFLPVFALPVFWLLPFATAISIYLFILGISLLLYFKVFQAMMIPPRTGKGAMLGKTVMVIQDIDPEGKIKYATEIWNAVAVGKKFSEGDKVVIRGLRGLKVQVAELPVEKK
jgi:membrane protein implicated in regulation of membrane protease activity